MKTLVLPVVLLLGLTIPSVAQVNSLDSTLPRILPQHMVTFQQSLQRSGELLAQVSTEDSASTTETPAQVASS
ncbi:MAG: hypothetical protein VX290_04950, partial [Candidatus Latescibacterota bacterium]|nr:hypothetical protein [Candidatus Latescibacterota bacterium]